MAFCSASGSKILPARVRELKLVVQFEHASFLGRFGLRQSRRVTAFSAEKKPENFAQPMGSAFCGQ
jgi:hypothetical protein